MPNRLLFRSIAVLVGIAALLFIYVEVIAAYTATENAKKATAEAITAKQEAWRQCKWGLKDIEEDEACDYLARPPEEIAKIRAARREATRCGPGQVYKFS
jgi:hypothetical protein